MNFELINIISFCFMCLIQLYLTLGYILRFFKYKSIYKRFYDDAPIFDLLFIGNAFSIGEILVDGIDPAQPQLVSILLGLIVSCVGIFPLVWSFFHFVGWLDKIRNNLPER